MRKIEISVRTVLFTLALIVGLWLIVEIRDILFLVFISFLLMTAIYPLVLLLERVKIPRAIGILLVYIIVLGSLGAVFASTIPALVAQTTRLATELPTVVSQVLPYWNIDVGTITGQLAPLSENIVKITVGIFSNIITTFTILVFTFYFLLERKNAELILSDLLGDSIGKDITDILRSVERKLGSWVRAELLLMTFVGVLTYIGLTILHIEFALPLAIAAGILEIVPIVGPFIAAVPAVFVALAQSPLLAISVAALYLVVQQIENNILVPVVMKKSIGLSPVITILALMIGGQLGGIIGAVLAVPVVLVFQVVIAWLLRRNKNSPGVHRGESL